jgi:hypothetical protein
MTAVEFQKQRIGSENSTALILLPLDRPDSTLSSPLLKHHLPALQLSGDVIAFFEVAFEDGGVERDKPEFMSNHGPFHRRGAPGGAGCEVSLLPISSRRPGSGEVIEACLLDAGETASELELLRTVASGLGVVWGRDDLGAWAMVPNEPQSAFAAPPATESDLPHALYREDRQRGPFPHRPLRHPSQSR